MLLKKGTDCRRIYGYKNVYLILQVSAPPNKVQSMEKGDLIEAIMG